MWHTLSELQQEFSWTIPQKQRDAWRLLYPNIGFLQHHGRCRIVATDGLLAAFVQAGEGQKSQPEGLDETKPLRPLFLLGHLQNFWGPVAKEHVEDVDWDWERNVRRVNVFRRKNGTIVILPCDSEARDYWAIHRKCSDIEHALFQSLAVGQITREECEESLERLCEREKKTRKPKKTSLEKALELLKKLT